MRFALTALLLLMTGPIAALPVRVMSRSTLNMQLNRTWNQLQVRGQLLDDNTDAVSGAPINLSIPKWGQLNTQSDRQGRFEFSLSDLQFDELMKLREHHHGALVPLQLSFAGDHRLGASSAEQRLDLSKEFLQLHAAISPPRSNVSSPPRILAVLRHGADPVPGQVVSVRIAGSTLEATTDRNGRVVFESPPDLGPGVYQAHIKFDGSARYNAAESTRQYTIERHVVVLLSVTKTRPDQLSIQVQGQLKGDALPLAGPVTITIHNNEYLLLEADKQGHFEGVVDLTTAAVRWGPRHVELRATYTAQESVESDAVSPALLLHLPSPPTAPFQAYLVPLLLLLFLVGAGGLWRSIRFQAWLRQVRELAAPAATRVGSSHDEQRPLVDRPASAGPRVRSTCFSAEIWDSHVDQALATATIRIVNSLGETVLNQTTDKHGKISTNNLANGRYTWQITCPGYLSERFTAQVPHAGHFHHCRVQMTPWRALALRAFERRIQKCGHHDLHLGVHTPNELAAVLAASSGVDSNAVIGLTTQFEALYFGGDNTGAKAAYQAFIAVLETVLAGPGTEEKRS